jgi:PAS domain S-box-containing protein
LRQAAKRPATVRQGTAEAAATPRLSTKRLLKAGQDLEARRQIFEAFFDHSVTPLVLLDRQFNFIRVNKAYADCCARKISDFPGHNHFEFYPSPLKAEFERVVRTRQPYRAVDRPFVFPDHPDWGETYWNLVCVPILNAGGKVAYLVFALEDVTERHRAETRLKATNRLLAFFASKTTRQDYLDAVLELLVELSGCQALGIRMLNPAGQIPYEAAAGFNAEFLKSECWLSLEHDHCACTRAVRGRPEPQDLAMMTAGGSFHCNDTLGFVAKLTEAEKARFRGVCIRAGFATVAVVPIRYRGRTFGAIHFADRRPGRLDPMVVEFMEAMAPLVGEAVYRFNIEAALRQSEERYRRIVEAATEGIWILDRDDRTAFVNQRMAEMLGYSVSEMTGRPVCDFVDDQWRTTAEANLAQRHRGIADRHDFKFRRKDGRELWAFLSSTPIRDEAGRYEGALAMVADITERRHLEQEVLIANDETCRRIGQDLHDSLGQILVGLTFQSKNMERKLGAVSREHAAEAGRITATAKEAATLARSLAHGLCPVEITPGGLMAALRELARRTAKTFRVRCTLTARVSVLMRDSVAASHVYQIVQEALTNAVTHGKASRIAITLTHTEGRIALRVRDNGVGVPKGAAKGLGLRTMQYRAGLLGGSCQIEPGPGGGTTVTCWLPAGGTVRTPKARNAPRPPRRVFDKRGG